MFRRRVEVLGRAIAQAASGELRRAWRRAQIRRLEWQLHRQQSALGTALFALLQSGHVQTDLPDVTGRMTEIDTLGERIQQLRNAVTRSSRVDHTKGGDESRWANEGGQNAI